MAAALLNGRGFFGSEDSSRLGCGKLARKRRIATVTSPKKEKYL